MRAAVLRAGGRFAVEDVPAPIRPSTWVTKRVTVRAAFAYRRADYETTIAMLERGTLRTEGVITSVVPSSETRLAFDRLLGPNSDVKALTDPSGAR